MPDDQSPAEIASHFDSLDASDLPEEIDEAAVERISTVAYLLDECITVPGTDISVGLDPLVGVIPVVGDAISAGISLYIVAESAYLGVSLGTVVRMLGNVAIDAVGGSIPYAGPVFDAIWKTNVRNLDLLLDDLAIDPESTDGYGGHDDHDRHDSHDDNDRHDDHDSHDDHDDHDSHDDGPIRIDVEDA